MCTRWLLEENLILGDKNTTAYSCLQPLRALGGVLGFWRHPEANPEVFGCFRAPGHPRDFGPALELSGQH